MMKQSAPASAGVSHRPQQGAVQPSRDGGQRGSRGNAAACEDVTPCEDGGLGATLDMAQGDAGAQQLAALLDDDAGSPVPNELAEKAEASVGAEATKARLHTGAAAAEVAEAYGMPAFAVGAHIVLGAGIDPGSPSGEEVVAHELVHVAQTGAAEPGPDELAATPGGAAEHDADEGAAAILSGTPYQVGSAPVGVHGFGAVARRTENGERDETSICHENQTLDAAQAAGFNEQDAAMIYSGNWQRDMNQFLIPKVRHALPAIYEILNILHIKHFGFPIPDAEEFGTYDPAEHMDQTADLTTADVFIQDGDTDSAGQNSTGDGSASFASSDPRYKQTLHDMQTRAEERREAGKSSFISEGDLPEFTVDQSGIPMYMQVSRNALKHRFAQGIRMANEHPGDQQTYERALRYSGEALHTMQDYYAHSNFCEIAINLLLDEGNPTARDGGDQQAEPADQRATLLVAQLHALNGDAVSEHLDSMTHAINADGADRDHNLTLQHLGGSGGREVMTSGSFNISDTLHSIKEKLIPLILDINPFRERPGEDRDYVESCLLWAESNPEFVSADLGAALQTVGGMISGLVPMVQGLASAASTTSRVLGTAEAATERASGAVRSTYHRVAAGITGLFSDDAGAAHERAAAQASRRSEAAARQAEEDMRAEQDAIQTVTEQLQELSESAAQGQGLSGLYSFWEEEASPMISLAAAVQVVPIIGPRAYEIVADAEKRVRQYAQEQLEAAWTAAMERVAAEVEGCIDEALGDTEQHDNDTGGTETTSRRMTQPAHTDIAKDFDQNDHDLSDVETVLPGLIRDDDDHAGSHDEHGREHEHRHAGAWLAGLGDNMAHRSSTDILTRYRLGLSVGPTGIQNAIRDVDASVDRWFAHPEDCRETWHGVFLNALTGADDSAIDLRRELARRTAVPPTDQQPHSIEHHVEGVDRPRATG